MKKIMMMLAVVAVAIGLTSCDDSVLSSSSAKKAIKKEAMFAENYATAIFRTGFYEVSESQLTELQQLQAAGMITFTTETVTEKAQRSTYNYWTGYRYYTVDVEHTFASVHLTDEGRKLVVAEPVTMRADLIEDLKANENYEEFIPDYMKIEAATEVVEEVVEVEVASTEIEEGIVDTTEVDSVVSTEDVAEPVETPAPAPAPAPVKADPNAAYEAALAKVNVEELHVLLGHFSLEKVKEIRCTEEMAKNGIGNCKAIITFKDKTPFGFVLGAPQENYLISISVSLVYYQDMGWTVKDVEQ